MKLRPLWDDLKSSLWFRPALWVVSFGVLALALIALDTRLYQTGRTFQMPWLFHGGADGARTMLGSIVASMLTVTTLAFSLTMIAVVQTASAYSPRILRQYLSDTAQQNVLGILMGTFLFSLLVLRVVQTVEGATFVPAVAVTVAILLAVFSIGAFIFFINHVAHSIEVRHAINLIRDEAEDLIDEIFPETVGQAWEAEEPPPIPKEEPATVWSSGDGYVQFIDPEGLMEVASREGIVVRLEFKVGEYLLRGMPLFSVWPKEAVTDSLADGLVSVVQLGRERTLVQDLHFSVRQLTDVALRAISPAINDPHTAVNCVDVLASLLAKMAHQLPVPPYRVDDNGKLRVIAQGPTFEALVDWAFDQIRHYAANDLIVTWRLISVCGDIGYATTRPDYRAALWRHATMIARSADRNLHEPHDRAEVNRRLTRTAQILQQDPTGVLLDRVEPVIDLTAVGPGLRVGSVGTVGIEERHAG